MKTEAEADHETASAMEAALRSSAFKRAVLESERLRVRWTITLLGVLLAFVIARTIISGLESDSSSLLTSLAFFGIAFAYEGAALVVVRRRLATETELAEGACILNACAEALFVVGIVVFMTFDPSIGPYRALVAPAVYLIFGLLILAPLRLNPMLARVSGTVGALGYLAVTLYTVWRHPDPGPEVGAFALPFYVTAAFFIFVAGFVSGAVAGQLRRHLLTALQEAAARHAAVVNSRDATIFGLAKLAEYRDTDTGAHLERIAEYTVVLARAMAERFEEIDDNWIERVRLASSMHDIGKVGIPDAVLQKPGRLTDAEREQMQRHTMIGGDTLLAVKQRWEEDTFLVTATQIAFGHHERWDGDGYPFGLSGDDIPLAARIVSVADVYDALTSRRVYKDAFTHQQASDMIAEGRGGQFDPAVVDAFLECLVEFDSIRAKYQVPA